MDKYMSTAADWACPICKKAVKGYEYHVCGLPDGVTAEVIKDSELEAIPHYTPLLTRIADTLECIAGLLDSAERAAITEAGRAVDNQQTFAQWATQWCDDVNEWLLSVSVPKRVIRPLLIYPNRRQWVLKKEPDDIVKFPTFDQLMIQAKNTGELRINYIGKKLTKILVDAYFGEDNAPAS